MGGMQLSCILWPGNLMRIIQSEDAFFFLFKMFVHFSFGFMINIGKRYLLADINLFCFGTMAVLVDA